MRICAILFSGAFMLSEAVPAAAQLTISINDETFTLDNGLAGC